MTTDETQTHCVWCGAEYPPPRDEGADTPIEPRKAVKPPPQSDAAAITHCGWCGAGYPEPDGD